MRLLLAGTTLGVLLSSEAECRVRAEEEAEDDQLEACFCEACCCQEGWARAHCDRGRTAAREDFQRGEDRGVAALGRREAVR